MTENQPPASTPEPKPEAAAPEQQVAPESCRHPALLESLAALGLLLVVAYTCWRLYGTEIGRMFAALFGGQ